MSDEKERELFIPADGDILGAWLASTLRGKLRYAQKSVATGKVYEEGEEHPVPGVYELITSSDNDPGTGMGMGSGCAYEIVLHWDQWVRCVIRCTHDTFEGVSRYWNVTEALIDAVTAFNAVVHKAEAPVTATPSGDPLAS